MNNQEKISDFQRQLMSIAGKRSGISKYNNLSTNARKFWDKCNDVFITGEYAIGNLTTVHMEQFASMACNWTFQ